MFKCPSCDKWLITAPLSPPPRDPIISNSTGSGKRIICIQHKLFPLFPLLRNKENKSSPPLLPFYSRCSPFFPAAVLLCSFSLGYCVCSCPGRLGKIPWLKGPFILGKEKHGWRGKSRINKCHIGVYSQDFAFVPLHFGGFFKAFFPPLLTAFPMMGIVPFGI